MHEDSPQERIEELERRLREETERRVALEHEISKIKVQFETQLSQRTDLLQEVIGQLQKEIAQRDEVEGKLRQRTEDMDTFIQQLKYEMDDRKNVEQTLRLSEERFRSVIENAPVGICVIDAHGMFEYLNPAYCLIYGYLPDDLIGESIMDVMPKTKHDEFYKAYSGVFRGEDSLQGEWEMLTNNGELVTVLMDAVSFISSDVQTGNSADGETKKLIIFALDITERKRAEDMFKRAKVVIDQSPAVIYQFAHRSGFPLEFVSDNISQFGYAPSDFIAPKLEELWYVHSDDRATFMNSFTGLRAQNIDHLRREFRLKTRSGLHCWVEDNIVASRDENGKITRYQGVLFDITERKKAEEEISKALEKERELVQLKTRFVTIASHEFRTPLTSIMLAAGILNDFGSMLTPEQHTENLLLIREGVEHMTQLLDDLLMFSRVDATSMAVNYTTFDISSWCEEFAHRIQNTMGRAHDFEYSVPQRECSYTGDESLLKQMLERLLSNAFKYSPERSTVRFDVSYDEQFVAFTIVDKGIGILQEDVVRIFEPFHRGANIGNIGGTGMGLAILSKLVELHSGTIQVQSSLQGTVFTLALPLTLQITIPNSTRLEHVSSHNN